MKTKLLAAAAVLAAALPAASYAQLAFNVGAVTDYRYRGISQTRNNPAVQGGIDYAMGGFYVGTWASTIRWTADIEDTAGQPGDNHVEIDLYGGYKGEIVPGLTFDVGVLTYQYPSNKTGDVDGFENANTTEVYGALTYGPATLKFSRSVSNTFANLDSKNSYYIDASAGFEVYDGWTLTPHVGYQRIGGPFKDDASYTDYALTVSKDFSGLVVSAAAIGTDADKVYYSSVKDGKKLGKPTAVLGVKYNF